MTRRRNMGLLALQEQQRKQELERKQSKRWGLMKIVGSSVIVLAGTGMMCWYASSYVSPSREDLVKKPGAQREMYLSFDEARKHPEKRQRFIDALVKKDEIPGCLGIVYDHDGEKIITYLEKEANLAEQRVGKGKREFIGGKFEELRKGYDVKTPDILELSGLGRAVPIFVGRKTFEGKECSHLTEQDLRAIFIFHEAEHVRQHYKGFSYLSKEETLNGLNSGELDQRVLYEAYEFDARIHEIPQLLSNTSRVSWYHLNDAKARFLASSLFLTKASVKGGIQARLVEDLHKTSYQQPLLHDVSVDLRWFEMYRQVNYRYH